MIEGASFLITGGSGSFGRAFTKRILQGDPARVVIYSRGEHLQESMEQEFNHPALRWFIGDVRDQPRLEMAMRDIDYVIHAAAMKVVMKCEYDPIEAIQTNIIGAENVIRSAIKSGVKKVVALSTDKACNPINLYGATKLAAEKLFMAAHSLGGAGGPLFSVARYGNIIGSRGSVLPYFKTLAADGKAFQITDERMTRFWMTMDNAVGLVLETLEFSQGREIFIPKIPAIKIVELALAIDPDLPHVRIGIRPGEKLHETLITEDEASMASVAPHGWIIHPQRLTGNLEGWKYTSNSEKYLSVEQIRLSL